ncbi:MAG: 2-dehydropantoate 2-reductase [Chloroflexi bacterium]|nr:2-dehydropantoate 2-reductase [Chloroflexota bacterium]
MRIAIMGSGGMGGYFGGMLARAGEDVHFIARGAHLEAMQASGLTVKTNEVGEFNIPAKATNDPSEIGTVDLVLFCVKTYDTEEIANFIKPLIGPDTVVMSLQNGVDNEEIIESVIGPGHVTGAVAYVSAKIDSPGVISESYNQKIILGELTGEHTQRVEEIAKAFEAAGQTVEVPDDIRVAIWSKLLGITTMSAITCVTRLPGAHIFACPETRALTHGMLDEGIAVAIANEIAIPDTLGDEFKAIFDNFPPDYRASMYHDLANGRRMELDEIIGVIVRLGEKLGVPTPLTFAVYASLKPYANGTPATPS